MEVCDVQAGGTWNLGGTVARLWRKAFLQLGKQAGRGKHHPFQQAQWHVTALEWEVMALTQLPSKWLGQMLT